ncbi:MAG: hypothetical protein K2M14_08155, partial [Muribaculaceae bacterium]|nr:hypothetical protein [Muribaculaceae bacterium]
EQYERAKEILRKYAKEHNEIRDMLLEREVIYHDDVKAVLGPRPWKSREEDPLVQAHYKMLAEKSKREAEEADVTEITEGESADSANAENPEASESVTQKNGGESAPQKQSDPAAADDEDAGTPPPFNK